MQPQPAAAPPVLLVVDDNADTVRFLARLLRSKGYSVLTADSVATATTAVDGGPIDLLVSDLGLADGSGLDLMRALRVRHPTLRGIALTGRTADEAAADCLAAGFARHVTKPVDFADLTRAVAEVLAGQ